MVLVDDILRSGRKLTELKALLESRGATVVGLAVIIYQPTPDMRDFGSLPLYYLAKLNASYYADAQHSSLGCTETSTTQTIFVLFESASGRCSVPRRIRRPSRTKSMFQIHSNAHRGRESGLAL